MFPLDRKTVERVAKITCDLEGPFERRGAELEELLRSAGLEDAPEYDGSPRIPWLIEALISRQAERPDIERFLCRLCDPLEYDGGMVEAEEVRSSLNRVLEPEMLAVSYAGARPVIGELRPGEAAPVFVDVNELEQRLRRLITDQTAVDLLVSRAKETRICEQSGAYGLALVGIGSLVESFLYYVLTERDADCEQSRNSPVRA